MRKLFAPTAHTQLLNQLEANILRHLFINMHEALTNLDFELVDLHAVFDAHDGWVIDDNDSLLSERERERDLLESNTDADKPVGGVSLASV